MTKRYHSLQIIQKQGLGNNYLSIAVRVKNEIKALRDFWNSLSKQTIFNHLEVVFLDSGSTDGTIEFLKTINCTIYIIDSKEFAFGDSCNLMMELCSSDYVCFFSGHVILDKDNTLEFTYNFIKKNGPTSGYYRQVPNLKVGYSIYDRVFLKYNFPKSVNAKPLRQYKSSRFSNAASIVARAHWNMVKFQNVIASEDSFWADNIAVLNIPIYYFHMFDIEHSHNENYATIKIRVGINAKARYPEGVSFFRRVGIFIKVFMALFLNSGSIISSLRYAMAHASAYKVI